MEKSLEPELRFPEFEGNWQEKKISDVASIIGGGTPETINLEYWNGNINWFTPTEIVQKYSLNSKRTISELGLKKSSAKILKPGTILFTSRATIGECSILIGEATTNQGFQSLYVNAKNYNEFIYYWLNNNKTVFLKLSSGSTFLEISKTQIEKIKINIPLLSEQQKIADYLSSIDKKINLLEEKKSELSCYKKAMMQQLFSQQIRFKDENGGDFPDWEETQLKDILKEHKEKNIGDKYVEVLSVAKMKGVVNQIEHLGRSYSAEKITHYKVINAYDIVYTKSPTTGFPFGIIKQNKLNRSGVLSPLYAVFKPKTKYLGMILHDMFLSEVETYNYLVPLVQKGAKNTMNINNDEFLNGKKYSLPTSVEEQQKIAGFLSVIDESIYKVNEQIIQTKAFKKAMLQQMFV